ncbi:hypothetical protein CA51_51000 [Rosistilla oblonga]|uniref:hypothetical protein n=1 Tax=Rosistilla oblonga TaxID=2527990 RepID=UPI00118C1914|nr:hypothetical protein [Rosistilla oblonga]QDV15188.1 hypothetical protein CA51_51000 [Rosistilla oblonga]
MFSVIRFALLTAALCIPMIGCAPSTPTEEPTTAPATETADEPASKPQGSGTSY